ncbi:MAG TPA: hypothetical protein VM598_09670 [Bdellovibrionota bacterium]|nr:hypothetical protein [Bdellovibrionota bacterium]
MRLSARAAWAVLTVGIVMGCTVVDSEQVDPETVHMSWWGEYDEARSTMQWRATFTVGGAGGTYLRLTGRSAARVNGYELDESDGILNIVDYVRTEYGQRDSAAARQFLLEYVDTETRTYSNAVTLPARAMIDPAQPVRVSLSAPSLDVRWRSTETLGPDDRIEVNLSVTGTTLSSYDGYASGTAGRVSFSREQLRQLQPDRSGKLRVCVTRSPALADVPPRGGDVRMSYCSAPKAVDIVQ